MSASPYMRVWIADYTADVQHLTCEQDGAYWRLLRAMWRAGGKLPNKPEKLATICGLTPRRWEEIGPDVKALFQVRGGQLRHKRLSQEIDHTRAVSDAKKRTPKGHANRSDSEKTKDFNGPRGGLNSANAVITRTRTKESPKPPGGASLALPIWEGPADVLAALTLAKDEPWALTWLAHCRYQDLPIRALITSYPLAADKLNQDAEGALRTIGVRVILEAAAA